MNVGGFLEFVAILVYIVLGLPELYNKTLPQTKQNKKPQNGNKIIQPNKKPPNPKGQTASLWHIHPSLHMPVSLSASQGWAHDFQ